MARPHFWKRGVHCRREVRAQAGEVDKHHATKRALSPQNGALHHALPHKGVKVGARKAGVGATLAVFRQPDELRYRRGWGSTCRCYRWRGKGVFAFAGVNFAFGALYNFFGHARTLRRAPAPHNLTESRRFSFGLSESRGF